ncbi:MAG: aminotransferase class V-fold PLP-dependent enzyme [Anaerolineales bacterium]
MELHEYRSLFPSVANHVYLNHAACSPLPTPTIQATQSLLEEQHLYGCRYSNGWMGLVDKIRDTAARFIGASPEEVALTRNTSHGLLLVANGLPWRSGDNLIVPHGEFTANVYPWLTLRGRGVEVRFAPMRDNRILPEDIEALMDSRTRLVAISAVQFGSGFRCDLHAIAAICRARGVLLCVDGIQALGQVPFNVNDPQVDFLSAGGPKWLMAPLGTGIFYCRKGLIEQLAPVFMGWRSTLDSENYYDYNMPWHPTARRFEEATLNIPGLLGLQASMNLLTEVGLERIRAHLLRLTDALADGLRARGYVITTPMDSESERSGIVCFKHPVRKAAEIHAQLTAANVIVSLRGDVIRVSPHFYNTLEEIESLLRALG